ncbi:MAG TPA: FAD-dependent oxidoreductase, partial [Ilumatobacter sp.]
MTRWLVIGAGAAGCVIAARLSERTDHQVTVLEAGPDHGPGHAATDVGLFLDDPGRSHGGVSVVRAAGRAPEHYWQGRGLGGSSLLNGPVLAVDPADADVEHLLPMEAPRSLGPVGAAVAAADRRAAPVVLSRRDGCRVSAADAYLRPALGRSNLTVVTDSPVAALVVEGRVVRGAVTTAGATHLADRVVVCAGALATPALLLTSGIDTPGVGEGLQDHPAIAVTLELAPGSINPAAPNITVAIDAAGTQILALNHLPGAPGFGSLVGAVMTP